MLRSMHAKNVHSDTLSVCARNLQDPGADQALVTGQIQLASMLAPSVRMTEFLSSEIANPHMKGSADV
jgi:hypothetical protein